MNYSEYIGFWWLPSNSENKVSGIMKFSPEDGIYLELLGTFETIKKLDCDSVDSYEIVLGFTKNGKLITLSEANRVNLNLSSLGIITKKYRVNLAFLGVHFNHVEEIKFFKLSVNYTYLSTWVYYGNPSFLQEWQQQYFENQDFLKQMRANINSPVMEAKTTKGTISVKTGISRYQSYDSSELSYKKCANITIDALREVSINEYYFDYLYPIQIFLTLATNENNFIVSITVFSHYGCRNDANLKPEQTPIEVISKIVTQDKQEKKALDNMLFSLKDIEGEFALYIQKWLNISDELKHICNIYFGIKYAEFMYGEQRFLAIVQVLESYHRLKTGNEQVSQLNHEERLKEIYDCVPEKYLDWLKDKLNFSHELSLKERIEQLASTYIKLINPLIKNKEAFATKIKNTRNYYTHYNQSLKKKIAQGEELFRLTQILSFLLQSCLLSELGCTPERCADLLSDNGEYQYTIEAVKKANFQW